jgi:hypothetical protein
MTTKTWIPSGEGVGEKTPLLISVADDIKPATSAVTTTPTTLATTATNSTTTTRPRSPRNSNSMYLQKKAEEIELLLSQPDIDLWKLRGLALTPGGLVNGTFLKIRQKQIILFANTIVSHTYFLFSSFL